MCTHQASMWPRGVVYVSQALRCWVCFWKQLYGCAVTSWQNESADEGVGSWYSKCFIHSSVDSWSDSTKKLQNYHFMVIATDRTLFSPSKVVYFRAKYE